MLLVDNPHTARRPHNPKTFDFRKPIVALGCMEYYSSDYALYPTVIPSLEIQRTPVSISTLAARNGLNGQTLRKQYKEVISGYRSWDQLDHADEYILYTENFGADMSLDETCLSNGEVYTILTNKDAHGGKGALAAMVRGVASDTVSAILRKVPLKQRLKVKTVTTDLSSAMMLTVRNVFPGASLVNDRFHVQQLISEAVEELLGITFPEETN